MKKSKKLMILGLGAATAAVAATASVSGFAWFAINDSVAATGMSIKADTNQMLEIKNAADDKTKWGTSAATGVAAKELVPTHLIANTSDDPVTTLTDYTEKTKTHSWVKNTAAKTDAHTAASTNYDNVTSLADDASSADNKYTLIADFDIRVKWGGDANQAYTLKATVDWVNTDFDTKDKYTKDTTDYYLHNSARVFLVVGAAGNVESQGEGYTFSSTATGTSGDWSDDAKTIKTDLKQTADGDDNKGKGVRVRAFFYFDGEDTNCFSDSAAVGIAADIEYSFKLTFDVTKTA